ncbi:hypothetical protein RKE38_10315 [Phycicoccus sp. M110.8]|uniref:hypothetical protein n=1 Tax=Phycicoccus sp. M110.8 TaxID=3075433 RepID=UPI0028FDAD20|nr:hypothetical protein [Phycicoccus sp. M110.8]MDU0314078.1 hypothetical protein [Phycicoccus sp. M110.8]
MEPVDGRGGDAGIDVLKVDSDGHTTIFQLKFFLDGFSGRNRARQRQIRDSLTSALAHQPDQWVLVLPSKLTRPDWAFISKLRLETDTTITVWHQTVLDDLLIEHPDVLNVMRRDHATIELLKQLGLEKAALTEPEHLAERVAGLGDVVDSVDPHWTFDFSREGNTVVQTLRAKHADAATFSPVTLKFDTVLGPAHTRLHHDMTRTLGYGLAGSVTLPAGTVKNFRIDGPPLVRRGATDDVQVSWTIPLNSNVAGTPVVVTLTDPAGNRVGTHRGKAVDGSLGVMGNSLQALFHDTLTLTYLVPHEAAGTCRLDLSWDVGGAAGSPAVLRRATQMVFDLATASDMRVTIDGAQLLHAWTTTSFAMPNGEDWLAELRELNELADDLDVINRATGDDIPIPASMTTQERIYLRCARLMLEGQCVMTPDVRSFTFTLKAGLDVTEPGLSQLLNDAEGQIRITHEPWTPTIAGHTLQLPDTLLWHPNMRLRNRAKVRSQVIAGMETAANIEPADGTTFRMFMPSRVADPDRPLSPVPWNLTGIDEEVPRPGAAG